MNGEILWTLTTHNALLGATFMKNQIASEEQQVSRQMECNLNGPKQRKGDGKTYKTKVGLETWIGPTLSWFWKLECRIWRIFNDIEKCFKNEGTRF